MVTGARTYRHNSQVFTPRSIHWVYRPARITSVSARRYTKGMFAHWAAHSIYRHIPQFTNGYSPQCRAWSCQFNPQFVGGRNLVCMKFSTLHMLSSCQIVTTYILNEWWILGTTYFGLSDATIKQCHCKNNAFLPFQPMFSVAVGSSCHIPVGDCTYYFWQLKKTKVLLWLY